MLTAATTDEILPLPRMIVAKVQVGAAAVAVVEVFRRTRPQSARKVKSGFRVGPRRAIASEEEERAPHREEGLQGQDDSSDRAMANACHLLLDQFRALYLPEPSVAREVIEANREVRRRPGWPRSVSSTLPGASPRRSANFFWPSIPSPSSLAPTSSSYASTEPSCPIRSPIPSSSSASLITQLSELNNLLPIQIQVARVPAGRLRTEDEPDYPLSAIRELALNAVAHRSYEGTNSPVRISWLTDRVEIQNPGGLYGHVNARNFGHVPDYRNPVLAEAMKALGYVDKFGVGIAKVESELKRNGNPPAHFELNHPEYFLATVRRRE